MRRLQIEVTGDLMAWFAGDDVTQYRRLAAAAFLGMGAPGVEGAAGRRIDGARHVPLEQGARTPAARRVGLRNGSDERTGVGMTGA